MNAKHPSARPFQSRDEFIAFMRAVSPGADLTGILLFGQLHRADHLLAHLAEKRLEATGLSWPKFRLLMMLLHSEREGRGDGALPSELSERQNISRNTASALIAGLEADGYIHRELHASDRRKFLIRLTAKGRKILQAQLDKHFQYVGRCFDGLTAEERTQLLDLLNRLGAALAEKTG